MNPNTGEIHHGTPEQLRAAEEAAGVKLIPIPERDMPKLKAMTADQRKCYAKQLQKRRRRAAAARKARRKQRR